MSDHRILSALLVTGLAVAGSAVAAEHVVIVREFHTSPGMPFGGSVRVIQRIEGLRLREDVTTTLALVLPDSLKNKGTSDEPLELTTVWFPEERVWRSWNASAKSYEESTTEEMVRSAEGDDTLAGIAGMFGGTRESMVQEVAISVDSTGAASTIAGFRARPYVVRATAHFHDLESNLGDSLKFVRELWIAPAIPGVSEALPGEQVRPARMWERVLSSMQFFPIPMLTSVIKRLEGEAARFAGHVLRDDLRLEAATSELARADGPAPDSTKNLVIHHAEVVEIRREASRPELFRVPANLTRREGASTGAPKGSRQDR